MLLRGVSARERVNARMLSKAVVEERFGARGSYTFQFNIVAPNMFPALLIPVVFLFLFLCVCLCRYLAVPRVSCRLMCLVAFSTE